MTHLTIASIKNALSTKTGWLCSLLTLYVIAYVALKITFPSNVLNMREISALNHNTAAITYEEHVMMQSIEKHKWLRPGAETIPTNLREYLDFTFYPISFLDGLISGTRLKFNVPLFYKVSDPAIWKALEDDETLNDGIELIDERFRINERRG